MRERMRIGAALLGGLVFGVTLVLSCKSGPSEAGAQNTVTCTVPPVQSSVTCTVPPVTFNPPARSSAAGTWSIVVTSTGLGAICSGELHLSGVDSALTGAWTCLNNNAGIVTGDFVAGRLRLNLANNSGFVLADVNLAADGKSAAGTGIGQASAGFRADYAVTLTLL